MDELATLAVAGHDDLGVGASARSLKVWLAMESIEGKFTSETHLGDQVGHGGAASRITAGQEAQDAGRVVDALNSEVRGTNDTSEGIEESRTLRARLSDVAVTVGATGPDDRDSTAGSAVSQLVEGVTVILTLGDGGRN